MSSCVTCGAILNDEGEPIVLSKKLFVVLRSETEWQEFIGVYTTKEKAEQSAEANAKHYHTVGPLSENYHKGCDFCHVEEIELNKV